MSETKNGLEWLQTIENPIIRCAALGEATNPNNPWIEALKCKFFSQKDALIGAFPFERTHQEYEFWKLYVRNMVGVYPAHLLPDGYTLPSDAHEWRYNPDNGFVYAALKEVEAPTQPTPTEHEYKTGEKVYILKGKNQNYIGKYIKCQHVVNVDGVVDYFDSNEIHKIGDIQQPTVPPTPIAHPATLEDFKKMFPELLKEDKNTQEDVKFQEDLKRGFLKQQPAQPTDAMSRERFVQEAAMRIYPTVNYSISRAIQKAIYMYNEIQNKLAK